ncbi:MAG TPA: YraN family protein [Bacillota bacterium]|nr:YraN family protein [Bacillota bacterium]
MKDNNVQLGKYGESLAYEYLRDRGYQLKEKNVRMLRTEIDLIVQKGQLLVFVEVKTRRIERFGIGTESVDERKQRKLIQAANLYLSRMKGSGIVNIRFDVIAISINPSTNLPTRIIHCIDAFRA